MWDYHDGWGSPMLFGSIWMIAFWAVIIGLVVRGVSKVLGSKSERVDSEEMPLDIARKRLARGEITRQVFDELTKALG